MSIRRSILKYYFHPPMLEAGHRLDFTSTIHRFFSHLNFEDVIKNRLRSESHSINTINVSPPLQDLIQNVHYITDHKHCESDDCNE